jgi:hypothetical protein
MSQRIIRNLCADCSQPTNPDKAVAQGDRLYGYHATRDSLFSDSRLVIVLANLPGLYVTQCGRCEACAAKASAEQAARCSLPGGRESHVKGSRGPRGARWEPRKAFRPTPGITLGNRPGMLPSQPDGLTWRQRAAMKSVS